MTFKAGDIVQIKEWDVMVKEYGFIGDSINVPYHFTESMSRHCGQKMLVSYTNGKGIYHLEAINGRPAHANFSKEMFKNKSVFTNKFRKKLNRDTKFNKLLI